MPEPTVRDLKDLAEMRVKDAQILLKSSRYSSAYYLAGYAVECGLKAIIAHYFRTGVIPDKKFVNDIYVHDLEKLLKLSGLDRKLSGDMIKSSELAAPWSIVTGWHESSRYELIDPFRASAMVDAVGNTKTGVVSWLKKHW